MYVQRNLWRGYRQGEMWPRRLWKRARPTQSFMGSGPFPSFERYCGSRNPARGVMAEGKCYKEIFWGEVKAKETLSGVWFTLPAVNTNGRDWKVTLRVLGAHTNSMLDQRGKRLLDRNVGPKTPQASCGLVEPRGQISEPSQDGICWS